MTSTQKSTDKNKQGKGKKAAQSSDNTELLIAIHNLATLQSRGLCVELPTELRGILAVPLATAHGLDHTVGNVRLFIVVDTRDQVKK